MPSSLKEYAAVDFRVLGPRPYERLVDGIMAALANSLETPAVQKDRGHVFLSYCREDIRLVRKLQEDLVKAGHEVWWDQKLLPGDNWEVAIHGAIEKAYAFVICFSGTTAQRTQSGIFPELAEAIGVLNTLPPENSVYLIPVRLSDCSLPRIPLGGGRWFDAINRLDLFSRKRPRELQRLVEALDTARKRQG
jgi:hypothetical protein